MNNRNSDMFEVLITRLEDVQKSALGFSLGFPHEYAIMCDKDGKPNAGAKPKQLTVFIRDELNLHHNSWVIGPVAGTIEMLKRNREVFERAYAITSVLMKMDIERLAEVTHMARKSVEGY